MARGGLGTPLSRLLVKVVVLDDIGTVRRPADGLIDSRRFVLTGVLLLLPLSAALYASV